MAKADVYYNLTELHHLLGGGTAGVLDSLLSLLSSLLPLSASDVCAAVESCPLSDS